MSPWIVGKPVEYATEKAPACIHLKVVTEHLRECNHPKFYRDEAEGSLWRAKCMFIDERLRDCAWYDCGDPNDKRALKVPEKKKAA